MKRFSKILSASLLLVILLLAFSACKDSADTKTPADTKASTNAPAESTAPTTTEPVTTEPVTTAADTSSSDVTLAGKTYVFDSMKAGDEDMSASITALYGEWEFVFKADGVCEQKIVWAQELAQTMGTDPLVIPGTYEIKGDKAIMNFEVEGDEALDMEFTIEGDTLKVVEAEGTTVFKLKAQD